MINIVRTDFYQTGGCPAEENLVRHAGKGHPTNLSRGDLPGCLVEFDGEVKNLNSAAGDDTEIHIIHFERQVSTEA